MRGSRHSTLSPSFKNSIPFSPFFENGIHRIQNHTMNIQSLTSLLILLTNCQVEKLPSGLCDFLEISCKAQKARHIQLFSLNYPLFALKNNSEHNAHYIMLGHFWSLFPMSYVCSCGWWLSVSQTLSINPSKLWAILVRCSLFWIRWPSDLTSSFYSRQLTLEHL